jgi:RNA polymerase sigma-70 factor (ECF subfamily)
MGSNQSESDLIRQAVAGDRVALSQLLLIHYDALRHYVARQITPELQGLISADDVLHQTFVRAASSIHSFQQRHDGALRAWLETIAGNLVKDVRKRRYRERRASPRAAAAPSPDAASSVAALVERIAADTTPPGRKAQRRENVRCLHKALAGLATDQREVIERYYLEGQSLEEIAETTGRSKDAVRGLCYRARKNLRALMGRSSLYFSG